MSRTSDGLTGYTLPSGYRLGPWERRSSLDATRVRQWKRKGSPAKLAAVAGASSWSIHRHVGEEWTYDNSGGCCSLREGKETVDEIMRSVTERMDRAAERAEEETV